MLPDKEILQSRQIGSPLQELDIDIAGLEWRGIASIIQEMEEGSSVFLGPFENGPTSAAITRLNTRTYDDKAGAFYHHKLEGRDSSTWELPDLINWFKVYSSIYNQNLDLRGMHLLDAGAGTGILAHFLFKYADPQLVTGLDISHAMLELAAEHYKATLNQRINLIQTPMEDIEKLSESFDGVLSSNALDYSPDIDKVLAGIYARLKPGGIFAFLIKHHERNQYYANQYGRYGGYQGPGFYGEKFKGLDDYLVIKCYREPDEWIKKIQAAGFQCLEASTPEVPAEYREIHPYKGGIIYVARKPV